MHGIYRSNYSHKFYGKLTMNLGRLLYKCPYLCFFACILYACSPPSIQQNLVTLSGVSMGTTYAIKLYSPDKKIDKYTLSRAVSRLLDEVNIQMSTYVSHSALSRFNQSTTDNWYNIPVELCAVIKEAMRINRISHGAFDITVAPLVNLWGFNSIMTADSIPGTHIILEALQAVGHKHFKLRERPCAIKKNVPTLALDLSAIAKGFAVDYIGGYLDEMAVDNYLIEVGGEVSAQGINNNQEIWRIGIEKPQTNNKRTLQTIVELNNAGMATSGDYRNYFEKDGKRYSHTIDPTTGKPVTHSLASVTVIHDSTMTADALATALLVLGPKHGLKLAHEKGIAAFFLVRSGEQFIEKTTPKFTAYLTNK